MIDKGYATILVSGVGTEILYALVAFAFVIIDELIPDTEPNIGVAAAT